MEYDIFLCCVKIRNTLVSKRLKEFDLLATNLSSKTGQSTLPSKPQKSEVFSSKFVGKELVTHKHNVNDEKDSHFLAMRC